MEPRKLTNANSESTEYKVKKGIKRLVRLSRRNPTDVLLWYMNRKHLLPAHVSNALRDYNNRVVSAPSLALGTLYNKLSGKSNNWLSAYKEADANPTFFQTIGRVLPMKNTEDNYTLEELLKMKELSDLSQQGPAIINFAGYRAENKGRYAGDVTLDNFFNPSKVIEWSLGQTGRTHDDENNTYLFDYFAYDTKDTKRTYIPKVLSGEASPVMILRAINGIVGSKGYNDGSNSITSIPTLINWDSVMESSSKQNK